MEVLRRELVTNVLFDSHRRTLTRPLERTLLISAFVLTAGCSDDRIVVREELLPFEPKAHLAVGPVSLADSNIVPQVKTFAGEIETGRPFYYDVEILSMSASGEFNLVEISAAPISHPVESRSLGHDLVSRKNILPYQMSGVVHRPLKIAGTWRGVVTIQEGPDGIRLGPARKVAEFSFEVVESKTDSASK